MNENRPNVAPAKAGAQDGTNPVLDAGLRRHDDRSPRRKRVIPAKAGIQASPRRKPGPRTSRVRSWVPACAGMTIALVLIVSGCTTLPYGIRDKRADAGFAYMKQGDWESAIASFTNSIADSPNDYRLYALRAKALYSRGSLLDAVADWSKAIELAQAQSSTSLLPAFYSDRGAAYYSLGRCEDALSDLSRSLTARDSAGDHAMRGGCLETQGKFEPALADFDRALARQPSLRLALGGRVDCLIQLKRYKEALDSSALYLSMHPDDGRYLFLQGVAYYHLGQTDKAKAIAGRAFATNEFSERVFGGDHALEMFDLDGRRERVRKAMESGRELEAAGKWQEALDALMEGWDHNLALTAQDRADAESLRQLIIQAYPHLTKKPPLPDYAERYVVEADSYAHDVGDFSAPSNALASYEKLASVVPWYPSAYFQAAIWRGRIGDYAGAVREMRIFKQLAGEGKDGEIAQQKIFEWEAKEH